MEDILKKPLFWVIACMMTFNVFMFFIMEIVVNKAADRVIEKLQREYSPSPYGPGLDPDKIDVNALNKDIMEKHQTIDDWQDRWQISRGF